MTIQSAASSPDFTIAAHQLQREAWDLCSDVYGGTTTVRAARDRYLPKGPAEKEVEYDRRIKRTEFYNVYEQTVRGLVGLVFRKNPLLNNDVPAKTVEHWEDIDGAGTHGDLFSRRLLESSFVFGHGGFFVDYPEAPTDASIADEQALQLRPYWVRFTARQMLSWRTRSEGGVTILEQLVLEEKAVEADGPFGEKEVVRYRRLFMNGAVPSWEVWTKNEKKEIVIVKAGTFVGPTRLPVVLLHVGEQYGWGWTKPPLLDLAYTNVAHYQVQSDHRYSLHIASVPILVFKGREDQGDKDATQAVGPNIGIDVPKDGDVLYVEHSGAALGQTREEQKDLEVRMATQGLSMMQRETRAAETAEAKRIDKAQQDSVLAVAARNLQDALESGLQFHAEYLKEKSGGSVTVNTDFENLSLDGAKIDSYVRMYASGVISLATLWEMLAEGNVLPDDFDDEEEKKRLEEDSALALAKTPDALKPGMNDDEDEEDDEEEEDENGVLNAGDQTPA